MGPGVSSFVPTAVLHEVQTMIRTQWLAHRAEFQTMSNSTKYPCVSHSHCVAVIPLFLRRWSASSSSGQPVSLR